MKCAECDCQVTMGKRVVVCSDASACCCADVPRAQGTRTEYHPDAPTSSPADLSGPGDPARQLWAPTTPGLVAPEPLGRLFATFLSFGLRAWGGPAAQLSMIRQETVAAGWVTGERFNRLLAVYQILPGPEATEMCVHLGLLRRGRLGAVLAGLGFALPGFILMLALSWAYVSFGLSDPRFLAFLVGFAPAVAALVASATLRLGRHAVRDHALALVAVGVAIMSILGVPFYVTLALAGICYLGHRHGYAGIAVAASLVACAAWLGALAQGPAGSAASGEIEGASTASLGISGLKAGLLTFGGAYTSIPFLQQDSVGHYVSTQQFLDGIALSGILPAPLIIFGTFLGFVGGGWPGALAMTAGIFAPAFAFTLVGHRHLENLSRHPRLAHFLDGVTAGVIGILALTAFQLLLVATPTAPRLALAMAAFATLAMWKSRWATPVVVLASGVAGAVGYKLAGAF